MATDVFVPEMVVSKNAFFYWSKMFFGPIKKMFSCPPSITKTKIWRIGIRIFGGSDVVNKLYFIFGALLNTHIYVRDADLEQ